MKKSKNNIWVYIDLRNRRHMGLSLNVLIAARELAEPLSGKTVAVLIGTRGNIEEREPAQAASSSISAEEACEACVSQGADEVYILKNPDPGPSRADIHANALHQLIRKRSPRAFLFPLTDFGREIAARCSSVSNAGLMADCVEFHVEDNNIIAGCPSWGGEIMARLTFSDHNVTGFATVQPHAFKGTAVRGNPGTMEEIEVDWAGDPEKIKRLSFSAETIDHRKLEEAKIVVVGGAGVGNADGFGMVRNLCAALGGEIGATRPPVINHWVDEEKLIGQTGKSVRPELLVSVGTSGAVQYVAGITESKNIVAINRDPDSPIFHVADTGIVADSKTFLPLLTARIKQEVMRDLADVLGEEREEGRENGFGAKVRRLRESHGWSVEELAQHTGQPPESIQQVEDNEVVPSVGFLLRISRALNVDPGTFLKDEEKVAIQDRRAQAFIKRTKNYAYQTLTPGAENQHLRGFMITIEPRQAHKPVAYKHEGEEFVYVMEGSLELTLGNRVNHLKVGESIHYNSEISHKLKNLGSETTRCLVILYTP
ncbi:FAD-binding protein [Deltaproteobacteria bacterium]|nr:FAD-binding protein [Deltaproteobacteria bacterium]